MMMVMVFMMLMLVVVIIMVTLLMMILCVLLFTVHKYIYMCPLYSAFFVIAYLCRYPRYT